MMLKTRHRLKTSVMFLVAGTVRLVLSNPTLKRHILALISRFPLLEARLRRVLASARAGLSAQNGGDSNLSPAARRIHAELIAAIERHERERA